MVLEKILLERKITEEEAQRLLRSVLERTTLIPEREVTLEEARRELLSENYHSLGITEELLDNAILHREYESPLTFSSMTRNLKSLQKKHQDLEKVYHRRRRTRAKEILNKYLMTPAQTLPKGKNALIGNVNLNGLEYCFNAEKICRYGGRITIFQSWEAEVISVKKDEQSLFTLYLTNTLLPRRKLFLVIHKEWNKNFYAQTEHFFKNLNFGATQEGQSLTPVEGITDLVSFTDWLLRVKLDPEPYETEKNIDQGAHSILTGIGNLKEAITEIYTSKMRTYNSLKERIVLKLKKMEEYLQ